MEAEIIADLEAYVHALPASRREAPDVGADGISEHHSSHLQQGGFDVGDREGTGVERPAGLVGG
jgi:hypothetical protein